MAGFGGYSLKTLKLINVLAMTIKAPPPRPGYVDRGMVMPAYPTEEQVQKMEAMQPSLRAAWNWLVSRIEEPLKAAEAKAARDGILPPAIPRPDYKGMEPEQAKAAKQEYIQHCADRRKQIFDLSIPIEWRPYLQGKGSEAERLGLKQDYQVISNYLSFRSLPDLPVKVIENLINNFKVKGPKTKRKKFRRSFEIMPIQVKSGPKLRVRRPKQIDSWHQRRCNAEVYLPTAGWIAVYLHPSLINYLLTPGNTVREGCTLRYEHGRWSASVKIIRREVMHPGPGDSSVVGIDPGLAVLATTSDNEVLKNPRNLKYADARELALSIADTVQDPEEKQWLRTSVFRQDARQRRRVLTQCRQMAANLSHRYDFIGVEANSGVALGVGSRYTGATKILFNCLAHRCGLNRVREVEPYYNSQACSQCGHLDKETWSRKMGQRDQTCKCIQCGYTADRDHNSAKNVKSRLLETLSLG